MALALKYRPKTFEEVIGNEDVVASVRSVCSRKNEEDLHHAMLFFGPKGCLRGDTVIFDPIDGSKITVQDRHAIGKPFHVVSWSSTDNRPVVAQALPPVRYHEVPMFRVETSQSTLFVTSEHRFLLQNGEFLSLRELRDFGCVQAPLRSISEPSLGVLLQDEFRYPKKQRGYQDRYYHAPHLYDEQLPLVQGIFQELFPSPIYARAHSRCAKRADGLAHAVECNRLHRLFFHPSMRDFFHLSCLPLLQLLRRLQGPSLSFAYESLGSAVFDVATCLEDTGERYRRSFLEVLSDCVSRCQDVFHKHLLASHTPVFDRSDSDAATIQKITGAGNGVFYDFHVPALNNYWAGGVFHHNCGKTTMARIVAAAYGIHPDDITEINVANDTGVDAIRETIRVSSHYGMQGLRRAFILDEAHMMTLAAQNAALKWLEEPPAHVFIFMASTDPHKLKDTVRSRLLSFEMRPLDDADMEKLLNVVLAGEGVTIPAEAIEMIITSAGGSGRMALSILDAVIDLDDATMLRAIEKAAASESAIIDLCQALMKRKKWSEITKILKSLTDEPETVRRAVLGYFTSVALNKNDPNAILMLDCFKEPYFNTGKAGLVLSCYDAIARE